MKISGEQVERTLSFLRETPGDKGNRVGRSDGHVSTDDVNKVLSSFDDGDDVRREMVDDIRRKVVDAGYEVPPNEVAEKLVGRLVADRVGWAQ